MTEFTKIKSSNQTSFQLIWRFVYNKCPKFLFEKWQFWTFWRGWISNFLKNFLPLLTNSYISWLYQLQEFLLKLYMIILKLTLFLFYLGGLFIKKSGKSLEICHIFGNLVYLAGPGTTFNPHKYIFIFKYPKND